MSKDESYLDPAEYLFRESKFHDCHLTVGDPETGDVEKIAVVTVHLASHSSVFHQLLVESDLADPTGKYTHITDIRPAVFKLMLRYVYHGSLQELNSASKETILELALCADKYNIKPLVNITCQQLIPTSVVDVFLALRCLVYIPNQILEPHVRKFIQEQTDQVIASKEFLLLDKNCLEFITKCEPLAVTELDLWKGLVKWGESQPKDCNITFRQVFENPMRNIRFTTLAVNDILQFVMPLKILDLDEIVELLTAVNANKPLNTANLCCVQKKRVLFQTNETMKNGIVALPTGSIKVFKSNSVLTFYNCQSTYTIYNSSGDMNKTKINIRTSKSDIELHSFRIKSCSSNDLRYSFSCIVSVYLNEEGYAKFVHQIKSTGSVFHDEDIVVPLKLSDQTLLRLKANSSYYLLVKLDPPHPTFDIIDSVKKKSSGCDQYAENDMVIKFMNVLHVKEIAYCVKAK